MLSFTSPGFSHIPLWHGHYCPAYEKTTLKPMQLARLKESVNDWARIQVQQPILSSLPLKEAHCSPGIITHLLCPNRPAGFIYPARWQNTSEFHGNLSPHQANSGPLKWILRGKRTYRDTLGIIFFTKREVSLLLSTFALFFKDLQNHSLLSYSCLLPYNKKAEMSSFPISLYFEILLLFQLFLRQKPPQRP